MPSASAPSGAGAVRPSVLDPDTTEFRQEVETYYLGALKALGCTPIHHYLERMVMATPTWATAETAVDRMRVAKEHARVSSALLYLETGR